MLQSCSAMNCVVNILHNSFIMLLNFIIQLTEQNLTLFLHLHLVNIIKYLDYKILLPFLFVNNPKRDNLGELDDIYSS